MGCLPTYNCRKKLEMQDMTMFLHWFFSIPLFQNLKTRYSEKAIYEKKNILVSIHELKVENIKILSFSCHNEIVRHFYVKSK